MIYILTTLSTNLYSNLDIQNVFPETARPIYIAGPCSAESETQVLQCADGLKNSNIDLFRAGIWKPRTRPDSFKGVGKIGLPWLNLVQSQFNLKVCTEVATTHHVEEALKANIDVFWIGARTTVNPFAVQALADALKGVDIPILIKNPINPDIGLWIGAIERFSKAGIIQIAAIHRGFSDYEEKKYRNTPRWQIPLDLKQRLPNIELICDHSHISGKRAFLHEVAQKAFDLRFDGLMTEVHPNPNKAWSDSAQQIVPSRYQKLIQSLILKNSLNNSNTSADLIEDIRMEIDEIDQKILKLLALRMEGAKKIGSLKTEDNISIYQPRRWANIIENAIKEGQQKGLSKSFIKEIFEAVHIESINQQSSSSINKK